MNRSTFVTLAAGASALAACGRQITPDPDANGGEGNLAGKMVIRFRVNGTLDFTNINYVIAFNTSGTGGEPYPQAYLTGYANFSYAFAVGASYGGAGVALPSLFQYIIVPGTTNTLRPTAVPLGASTTQFIASDSSQNNEFELTFTRDQLDNPLQLSTAAPGATLTPYASPTPGLTASPSPSPTPSGFVPTPTPLPEATSQGQRYWYINFFTLDRSGNVLDSLGQGGPTDTSFVFTIDTATQNLQPIFRPSGVTPPSNTSAYIAGGEVDTYP